MTHSYSGTGNKNVSVKITNACGKDTTLYKLVKVNNNVTPVLSAGDNWGSPSSSACPNDSVLFYASGGKSYLWEFGDGTSTTFTVPVFGGDRWVDVAGHKFSAKADYKIRLTLTNNCNKSAKDSMMFPIVDTAMPSGDFNYESDKMGAMVCSPVRFMAYGGSSYKYYFGDGDSLLTTEMYATHQFRAAGNYHVTLKIMNNCGKFITRSKDMYVGGYYMGIAGYDPNDSTVKACPGDTVTFYAVENGSNYTFHFGDGTSTTNVTHFEDPENGMNVVLARHAYSALGKYNPRVVFTNLCGAQAADTTVITIGNAGVKPVADFVVTTNEDSRTACMDIEMMGIGGASFKWKFGDGDSLITTASVIKHKYQAAGMYNITLIVTNGCGMKDTTDAMKGSLNVRKSEVGVTDTAACAGDSLLFFAQSGSSFIWNFGDGKTGTVMSDLVTPGGTYKIIKHAYAANGSYKVKVDYTNACGAAVKDSFMVGVNGSRPVTGSFDIWQDKDNIMACKPVDMMATGGMVYKWHFGDGDSLNTTDAFISHAFTAAGNYQITCKVINGCGNSATYNQSVSVSAMIVSGTPTNPLCNAGASGSVNINVIGGTAPYTYLWNNNDTAKNPTGLLAGNYTVTVRDYYGCEMPKSFTLTDPSVISMTSSITNAGCSLSDGGASITPSGGKPDYTYLWSTGETVNAIASKPAGIYTVTVKDANLCPKIFSVAINNAAAPAVTLADFTDLCANGTTLTLSGGLPAGGSYKVNGTVAATFDPKLNGQGTYNITYTYTDGSNCTGSAVKTLKVNPVPDVSLGTISHICQNEPVLTFTTGYPAGGTYKLDGVVAGSLNPAIAAAGTHPVIYSYTDGKGCAASDTQTIDVRTFTVPTLASFGTVCTSSPVITLSGGLPVGGSYLVEGLSATTLNPVVFTPGTYNIKYAYTNNGCSAEASNSIVIKSAIGISGVAVTPACNAALTGSVNITVTGGTTPYGFEWNNNATSEDLTGVGAGNYSVTVTDAHSCVGTKSFSLTEPTPIVPNPSFTNTSVCAASDGSATVVPSGGTGSYTYLWSPGGATTNSITGKPAGIYSVTIKDANNCPKTVAISISEPGAPVITFPAFADVCSNSGVITFNTATPAGGTYKVNGTVATTFDPIVYGAGTYSISYTVTSGCTASDVKTLTVNAAPAVTLGAFASVCQNEPVVNFTSGFPAGGSYKLDGVFNTSIDPAVAAVGSHQVIYSYTNAKNCTAADTENITVKSYTTANLAAFTPLCSNKRLYTFSGGTPAGGIYKIGATTVTTFDPSVNTAGTYNIIYEYTTGGCTDTAMRPLVLKTAPTVALTAFADRCINSAAATLNTGTPAGGIYKIDGTVATSLVPVSLTAATHTIEYTYTSNGCPDTATQSVVIKPVTAADLSNFAAMCKNEPVLTLSGGTPVGGAYSIGGTTVTTFDPSARAAGTYNVEYIYTTGGCSDTARKSIQLNAVPVTALTAFASLCSNNDSVTLSGGTPAGGVYKVNDTVATGINPAKRAAGTYTVKYIVTVSGCKDSTTQTLKVNKAPSATLAAFDSICNNAAVLTLSGGLPAGGAYLVDKAVATTFNPATATAGTHTILYAVADTNACVDTAQQTIFVKTCVRLSNESITGLEIYPNPTKGIVNVSFTTNAKQVTMKLVNAAGQLMSIENIQSIEMVKKIIDLGGYPSGVYMLVIIANDEVVSAKIILAK